MHFLVVSENKFEKQYITHNTNINIRRRCIQIVSFGEVHVVKDTRPTTLDKPHPLR